MLHCYCNTFQFAGAPLETALRTFFSSVCPRPDDRRYCGEAVKSLSTPLLFELTLPCSRSTHPSPLLHASPPTSISLSHSETTFLLSSFLPPSFLSLCSPACLHCFHLLAFTVFTCLPSLCSPACLHCFHLLAFTVFTCLPSHSAVSICCCTSSALSIMTPIERCLAISTAQR